MPTSISQRLARWFLGAGLGVGLGLVPATVRADPSDDARAHVAQATRAHKEGRYEDARAELEAAYALAPKPELLYALGQIHAKLGRCREASAYFQRFAATQSDPQVAKVVDQAIAACKPAAAAPDPASPAGSPSGPASGSLAGSPASPPASGDTPAWYHDKLGDGLVIGGAVVAVIALIEYRSAVSDLDAAQDRASTTTLARYHELVGNAHDERTASLVMAGAASALIAGGIARYALHDRTGEAGGVAVVPAPGGGIATYQGRF